MQAEVIQHEQRKSRDRRSAAGAVAVFLIAFLAAAGAVTLSGPAKPIEGDGRFYLELAQSMLSGKGYRLEPWTGPSTERMPGWPAMMTPALALLPRAPGAVVVRYNAAFIHALGAVAVFGLALLWSRHRGAAVLAGVLAGTMPAALAMVVRNLSEIGFMALVCFGLWLLFSGGRRRYGAALVLGAAATIRPNFLLVLPAALVLGVCLPEARQMFRERRRIAGLAAVAVLFCLLPGLWAVRNYRVTGQFPVMASIEGETLYGSNNPVVANELSVWGTWIMPDHIPGEIPKQELARRLPAHELSRYYRGRALEYLRHNLAGMPRLWTGKLVRGFVPVAWEPRPQTYLALGWCGLAGLAVAVSAPWWWRAVHPGYLVVLGALFLVNLATTVVYYGDIRFTYSLFGIYTLPLLAAACAELRRRPSVTGCPGRESECRPA
jgi:hypothetical protein